jgi:hypothetical protein
MLLFRPKCLPRRRMHTIHHQNALFCHVFTTNSAHFPPWLPQSNRQKPRPKRLQNPPLPTNARNRPQTPPQREAVRQIAHHPKNHPQPPTASSKPQQIPTETAKEKASVRRLSQGISSQFYRASSPPAPSFQAAPWSYADTCEDSPGCCECVLRSAGSIP